MKYLALALSLAGCSPKVAFRQAHIMQPITASTCVMIITEPGTYALDRDIYSDTCGIEIKTNDLKLNLNGHTIQGPNSLTKISYGIRSKGFSNVEVFNGIVNGFMYGIALQGLSGRGDDTRGNKVRVMQVSNSSFRGIKVEGYDSEVTNNQVTHSGKTEVYPDAYGFGIETLGPNCIVSDNTVLETYGTSTPGKVIGEGVAISFSNFSTYCKAERNHIENIITVSNKSTFGFWVDVYSQVTLSNNYVRNMHYSGIIPPFSILDNNDLDIPFANVITDRP